MKVVKRGKYYHYRFVLNGKPHRASTKRTSKKEAEAVMMEAYKTAQNVRQLGEKPETSLSEAMDRVVDSVEGETRRSYDLSRRKLLGEGRFKEPGVWSFSDPDMPLHKLTQEHLDEHRNYRNAEGLRPNSVNIEIRFIRRVVNFHRKRFKTPHPDDIEFTMFKPFVRKRVITQDQEKEIEAILGASGAPETYGRANELFAFLMDHGPRLNEALHMGWSQIDMQRETVEIYRDKTESVTTQPISDRCMAMFRRFHNSRPHPFIRMDHPLKVLRKVINDVCNQEAKQCRQFGRATVHSCRDTYVTRMRQKGMSLGQVGKLVGHGSIETTKKYDHLTSEELVDAARKAVNG